MELSQWNDTERQINRRISEDTKIKKQEKLMEVKSAHKKVIFKKSSNEGEQTFYVVSASSTSSPSRVTSKPRNPCLVTLILVTVVAVFIGLTIYVINIYNTDKSTESVNQIKIPVLRALVFMKFTNKEFHLEQSVDNQERFINVSYTINHVLNEIFLRSTFSKSFYGAKLLTFSPTSLKAKTELLFLDTGLIQESKTIIQVIENGGKHLPGGEELLQLADLILCLLCTYVRLVFTQMFQLPQKPKLKNEVSLMIPGIQTLKPVTKQSDISPGSDMKIEHPVVIVSNQVAFFLEKSVSMSCKFLNVANWSMITITHQSKTLVNIKSTKQIKEINNQDAHFIIIPTLTSSSGNVVLNITQVRCSDSGQYECTVFTKEGVLVSSSGFLHVKVLPEKPVLTLPDQIIANQQIKSPITCQAIVGFPVGTITMKIKTPHSSNFIQVPVQIHYTVNECLVNGFVLITAYTPFLEANDTKVYCEVDNTKFDIPNYNTTKEMTVLGDEICRKVTNGMVLRHPYFCDRYITCYQGLPTVNNCPQDFCFNPATGNCGETAMNIETSAGSLDKGTASVSCRLINFEEWQTISLMKRDRQDDTHQILLTLDKQRKIIWFNKHLESRSLTDVKISRYDVTFQLWIYGLQCSDKGLFVCRASSSSRNLEAERFLKVSAKPEPPEMLLPLTLVNGSSKRNNITCSADVGFPPGNLVLSKRLPHESVFHDIVFDYFTKVTEKDQCTTTVKGEYFVSGEDSLNGTLIKCEVRNASGIPSVSVNNTLYVLKKNECKERKGGYIPHPNDCRYFIQCAISDIYISRCSQGLCFNPSTEKCDLLEPKTRHSAESLHPCRSDRHGDYFPHPVLCNKYFWCVQGKEVLQHCHHGTLYHRNGQCTFNIAESFCYNKTQTE